MWVRMRMITLVWILIGHSISLSIGGIEDLRARGVHSIVLIIAIAINLGKWKRAVTQVHPAMHPIKHTLQFALFSFTKVSRMCCYSLARIQNSCLKKRALLSSICSSFPLQALAEAGPGSSGRGTAALPASLLCPHANNSSLGAQKCQEGSSQSQKAPASPPRGYTASKCHIKDKCSRAVCFRRIFVLQKRRLHRGSSQYHNLFLTRVGGWSR